MYHYARERCFLNSEDRTTRDTTFFSVLDAIDYYHRTCYNKPSNGEKTSLSVQRRDSVFDDKCYETIKGKVLVGIVDQLIQGVATQAECLKRCQKSKDASDIVCKSAIYYEKEKECIIASQSRVDIPDLFIEDDQAVYMENTCLNDSGASMKKLQEMSETSSGTTAKTEKPSTEETTTSKRTESTTPSSLHDFSAPTPNRAAQETRKAPTSSGTVEQSGYDSPSDMVADHSIFDVVTTHATTTPTTTEKPTTTINAKVIDTYGQDAAVKKTPVDVGYGKRLRDSRVKECFKTRELCALSTSHIVDGGNMQDLDAIVYHNRNDC
ncbi:PAN domain protein [Teladorsagia circumcincta]|uniref:PAN domain protein n=1 Tax=Teladorsagia circumcincta TaxID=45464 RepID=A0A2G9UH07_TELCI|nr:PAN domain protein [Teladorsagia circumcincta]